MNNETVCVNQSEYNEHGCIKCGCDYCFCGPIRMGNCAPVTCGECGENFIILADGLKECPMGIGEDKPKLITHPRIGIPKHEYIRPDIKPHEGEYWGPRGVGYDLSGFVKSKQAGERIVAMVEEVIGKKPKSWLDYRKSEPTWIQVKIQKEDGFDLNMLTKLCYEDGIITKDRLIKSLNKENNDEQ